MNRRMLHVLLALLTASVTLAGCTDGNGDAVGPDSAIEGKVDETEFQLEKGKGAISGLLVDDRFRPLHLTEDPQTEFQFAGFILLQETGEQVKTNENGEFSFVDLDPGEYTLRATIDQHELSPYKITVEEGVFAEATLLARRVSSESSLILTEEYSGFVTCAVVVPAVTATFNCNDGSGESYRTGARTNYTGIDNVTYLIVESMLLGEPEGAWRLTVRENDGTSTGGTQWADRLYGIDEENYVKTILMNSDTEVYNEEYNTNPWNNTLILDAISFYDGVVEGAGYDDIPGAMEACHQQNAVAETLNNATPPPVPNSPSLNCEFATFGTGAAFAQRTQFIISVFVGEPEVDLETYRLLTPESS